MDRIEQSGKTWVNIRENFSCVVIVLNSFLAVFFRNSDLTGMDNCHFCLSVLSFPSFGNQGPVLLCRCLQESPCWVGI